MKGMVMELFLCSPSTSSNKKFALPRRHPASIASLALAQAVSSSSSSSSADVAAAASKAARDLSAALLLEGNAKKNESEENDNDETPPSSNSSEEDPTSKALKIAVAAGAVSSISKALTLFEKSPELLRRKNKKDLEALLCCLARLSGSDAGRDAAGAAGVPAKLCDLLVAVNSEEGGEGSDSEGKHHEPDLVAALASASAAAATAHEGNKCTLVDCGFGAAAAAALLRGGAGGGAGGNSSSSAAVSPAAIRSLSAALCSLATADDPRPAASRAFQNGRTLGSEGVPTACLAAFRRAVAESTKARAQKQTEDPVSVSASSSSSSWLDTAASAAMAARRSVVNDELCREFADSGGATSVLRALLLPSNEEKDSSSSSSFQPLHHVKLARSCCSLLRQLAGSDALKAQIVDEGGFELVTRVVAAHAMRHSVAEQALGLLVALTLRNPDVCASAVEAGCVKAAAEVLGSDYAAKRQGGDDNGGDENADGENAAPKLLSNGNNNTNKGSNSSSSSSATTTFSRNPHQWAQRQACAALRNLVSRSPELRPVILLSSKEQGGHCVEALLRAARDRYPEACGDVGAAALRDLGCEDYDGKKRKKEVSASSAMARAEADGRFRVAA